MQPGKDPRFLIVPIVVYGLIVWFLLPNQRIVDEQVHVAQIDLFLKGQWTLLPDMAIWPVLHTFIQFFLRATPDPDLQLAIGRSIVAMHAVACMLGIWRILLLSGPETARVRALQIFASPVFLPVSVLVYTDIPALTGLVWAFYGIQKKSPSVFFGAMAIAVLLRQSNVVWLVVGSAYFLYTLRGELGGRARRTIVVGTVLFLSAWVAIASVLGGIAAGSTTQSDHLLTFRGLPNVAFMFAVGALLHGPILVAGALAAGRAGLLWKAVAFAAFAVFTGLTFEVSHRFNNFGQTYFLRNMLLELIVGHGMVVFPLVAALGAVLHVSQAFAPRYDRIRLPFWIASALYLLPFWLIEQRYYLPIYLLFNLMRQGQSRPVEHLQWVWNLLLSAVLMYFIVGMRHFL